MERIVICLVKRRKGVLAILTEKLREMNVNIRSVAVSETEGEDQVYITLVIELDDAAIEDARVGLMELDVTNSVECLSEGDHYERELLLVRVSIKENQMSPIMQIAEVFHAHVAGVGRETLTLEYVGQPDQVEGLIKMLRPFGVEALARTGRTALKKDQ